MVWRICSLSPDPRVFGGIVSNCISWLAASCSQLLDPVAGAGGPGSRFKGKHSLDSDEEEEEGSSKYDILASEDVKSRWVEIELFLQI